MPTVGWAAGLMVATSNVGEDCIPRPVDASPMTTIARVVLNKLFTPHLVTTLNLRQKDVSATFHANACLANGRTRYFLYLHPQTYCPFIKITPQRPVINVNVKSRIVGTSDF